MLPHPTLKSSEEKRTARAAAAARALSASLRGIFYKLKALSSKLPPAFPYKLKANSYQLASLILLLALAITLGRLFLPGLIPALAGTQIGNSLRFTPASSQYLNRTPGGAGTSDKKFTISYWVKKSDPTATYMFVYGTASANDYIGYDSNTYTERFWVRLGGSDMYFNGAQRDPSAWSQFVVAVDTTQSVASNRVQVYQNGIPMTLTAGSYPALNTTTYVNQAQVQNIGRSASAGAYYFGGYLADFYSIDGQQLTPSSFAETDSTTGAWQSKGYSGTYGTNGFHLTFSNSGALGTDSSGNGNTWTANNFNTYDQVSDTPTNNFATLSSINIGSGFGLSSGGLRFTTTANNQGALSTTAIASGTKAYFEFTNGDAGGGVERYVGVTKTTVFPNLTSASRGDCGVSASSYCYYNGDGNTKSNGSFAAYGNAWTSTTDVVGVAVDLSSGKIWFSKNCTWQASGDPAAGTNPAYSGLAGDYFAHVGVGGVGSGISGNINFGQGGTTTLSYNAAAGGYFYCTPPSGFKALSTANLPTPAIQKPSDYFDAATYTGTGAAQSLALGHAYGTAVTVYLTSGTTWAVPADFNPLSNTVEVIGGGGGGSNGTNFGGGGGGAYSKVTNAGLTPGNTISYAVGSGGSGGAAGGTNDGTAGGDTYMCSSTSNCASIAGTAVIVGAKGGGAGTYLGGVGGAAASGVGATTFSGGNGGNNAGSIGGDGGGGAAGPNGAGGNSSNSSGDNGTNGGAGDNGSGGAGGTGSVTDFVPAGAGGAGSEWDASHGSGGGGGGGHGHLFGSGASAGGAGGLYGGGGGSGASDLSISSAGAAGAPGIIRITYTSTGRFNFTPTLTWLKDRTSANAHGLFDSVRAVFPYWSSNANTAETGGAGTTLTAFLSNGFSLGGNALFNTNGNSYISWNWKESPTAGFDIVTYEGDNTSNRNISHSLGVAPEFVIVKRRDSTGDPYVWHAGLTGATYFTLLDSTAAQTNTNTPWGTGNFSSTQFMVTNNGTNNANASGGTYVAYLFKGIDGYSKFGTYTGNGSADGPFVYTGFKPRYVMIKRIESTESWRIHDTARDVYNPSGTQSNAHLSSADNTGGSGGYVDFLGNGFKLRSADTSENTSSGVYAYAAFADIPFQQSAQPYNLTIASSTRFVSGSSDYLSRTPGSAGNTKTWTWSGWVKRGSVGTGSDQMLLNGTTGSGGNDTQLRFNATTDTITFYLRTASPEYSITTSGVFRDPSKWYHIVMQVDTTQATASDRLKLYVDGVRVTNFSATSYPAQNTDGYVNAAVGHALGRYSFSAIAFFDGYLSDAYLIDGQALDPSYFGEYDTNGYWRPKSYSGTYGTNGFHLPLMGTSTASGIGLDTSGNNNTWTVNNITTTDFVKDTPTNNFATLNPIDKHANYTLTNGNLNADSGSITGSGQMVGGTTWVTSGKWYWEFSVTGGTGHLIGVAGQLADRDLYSGYDAYGWGYYQASGNKFNNGGASGTAYGNSYTTNDIISVALDMDNAKIWWAKNGTWQASGDPAAGTNAAFTNLTIPVGPAFGAGASSNETGVFNFGQSVSPTSTATVLPYRSSAGGYFQYTPPSGFKALSTANMATPTITKPNNYFDAKTYTGSGAATSTWSGFLNFQPDLVWLKDRTSANAHGIFDAVRREFPYLSSNSTAAEVAAASTTLTNFFSGGFSLGGTSLFNTNGNSYISWNWKEDTTAGFDIVTYTGDNTSNRSVSHGLGAVPAMIITKSRSTRNWHVWHQSLASDAHYLTLNLTDASSNTNSPFGSGAKNSSTFTVTNATNNDNASGETYVAYLWSEVSGFSKFGTYTGNASTDGPFVYTGFKPRYVMIKRTDSTQNWNVFDTARSSYNPTGESMQLNVTDVPWVDAGANIDMLSNGFKLRNTDTNASSATYIYAAFAEIPFKYASAGATGLVSSLFFNEF